MKSVKLSAGIVLALVLPGAFNAGCGGAASVTNVETREATVIRTVTSAQSPTVDNGPVMPNIDAAAAQLVTDIALQAYEREWGDGSGVRAVWGPNIVSEWALIGVENSSGAAGKDVLLHLENSAWRVKDMGHALSAQWENQTPPGLWPSM
jgi:hypothetical protein